MASSEYRGSELARNEDDLNGSSPESSVLSRSSSEYLTINLLDKKRKRSSNPKMSNISNDAPERTPPTLSTLLHPDTEEDVKLKETPNDPPKSEVADENERKHDRSDENNFDEPPSKKSKDGLPKRFFCGTCNQGFTRKHNMVSHELIHTSVKPHVCTVCSMKFRRIHDLKRHEKLHSGSKPFVCTKCDRSFARPDALTRHHNSPNACSGLKEEDHELKNESGNTSDSPVNASGTENDNTEMSAIGSLSTNTSVLKSKPSSTHTVDEFGGNPLTSQRLHEKNLADSYPNHQHKYPYDSISSSTARSPKSVVRPHERKEIPPAQYLPPTQIPSYHHHRHHQLRPQEDFDAERVLARSHSRAMSNGEYDRTDGRNIRYPGMLPAMQRVSPPTVQRLESMPPYASPVPQYRAPSSQASVYYGQTPPHVSSYDNMPQPRPPPYGRNVSAVQLFQFQQARDRQDFEDRQRNQQHQFAQSQIQEYNRFNEQNKEFENGNFVSMEKYRDLVGYTHELQDSLSKLNSRLKILERAGKEND